MAIAPQTSRHRVLAQAPTRKILKTGAFYLLVLVFMLPGVFIFFWMIGMSFKSQVENTAYPPVFIPASPTFNNYAAVFERINFFQITLNSLIIALGATSIGLVVGLPAAYAIVRYNQKKLGLIVLVARIIPAISFLIPWYILFKNIGLLNTYIAIILTHVIITLPVVVWLMIGFFEELPKELEEAGMIDGCSIFGGFRRIALPLVKPGTVATAILCLIFSWNNFIFSVILAGRDTKPLPVAVYSFLSYEEINWGPLAAAACLITLPVLVLTLFLQKHIVTGMTTGAVKG